MDTVAQLQNTLTNRLSHSDIVLFKANKASSVGLKIKSGDRILPEDNHITCISDKPIKIIKLDATHDEIITCTKEIVEQLMG